jgi:RNA polymerase sigma-70 factor (ECF subfamily)
MDDPDTGALRALCDTHTAASWRYALRLTGDRARAADVVQETMLRAWRHPEDAADTAAQSGRAWLFTLARNTIIEQRSARFLYETPAPGSVLPDRAGPDEVNAALDRLLVGDALAQLSADHRAVVRCACYQGCTTAEIAADFHIADGTVKSRLHDALRALWLELREIGLARQ